MSDPATQFVLYVLVSLSLPPLVLVAGLLALRHEHKLRRLFRRLFRRYR